MSEPAGTASRGRGARVDLEGPEKPAHFPTLKATVPASQPSSPPASYRHPDPSLPLAKDSPHPLGHLPSGQLFLSPAFLSLPLLPIRAPACPRVSLLKPSLSHCVTLCPTHNQIYLKNYLHWQSVGVLLTSQPMAVLLLG